MKTIDNKSSSKKLQGEYASIEEFAQAKLALAKKTLEKVDLNELQKYARNTDD